MHNKKDLKLWYTKPASQWVEALPVGNGRLGGMIFGGVENELIQLNEDTLWSGYPKDSNNYEAIKYLDEVRKLILDGEFLEAQNIINKNMLGPWNQSYVPLGNLSLKFDESESFSDYKRELDLRTAIATTTYKVGNATYKRQVFCSEPDQVMVIRITCDTPEKVSFTAKLDSLLKFETISADNSLALEGLCPSHVEPNYVDHPNPVIYDNEEDNRAMRFRIQLKVLHNGGNLISSDGNVSVCCANEATLILTAATSYNGLDNIPGKNGKDYISVCENYIRLSTQKDFTTLLDRHVDEFSSLFGRVEFSLKAEDNDKPTDERLECLKTGVKDLQLIQLLFQYGRYLLISSSRKGTQPANLQGIWTNEIRPPWSSNYTININAQMNYWPVEVCNLSECHEPLFTLLKEMAIKNTETAKVHYNCNGWVANHNIDLWRSGVNVGGSASWAYWPVGGAWMCQHLFEHYSFSLDKNFLKEVAYPIMKGAAQFLLDYMIEDEEGHLVTCPSTSPENFFYTEKGEQCCVSMGSTMDMSITWDLFTNCIEACHVLDYDLEFCQKLESAKAKLLPPQIGKHGQLQEWFRDFDEPEPGHRHISHLFGLHPGKQILPHIDTELAQACRRSLERRLSNGGGHTGWSCAWIINQFARLEDGNSANKYVNVLLTKSTYPNMFDAHPPFQIDGNFGATAGIAEMLLQSHAGEISLLPALPDEWETGYITGLCARGGYEVNISWEAGKLALAIIKPKLKGKCRVRYTNNIQIYLGNDLCKYTTLENGVIEFDAEPNTEYFIKG